MGANSVQLNTPPANQQLSGSSTAAQKAPDGTEGKKLAPAAEARKAGQTLLEKLRSLNSTPLTKLVGILDRPAMRKVDVEKAQKILNSSEFKAAAENFNLDKTEVQNLKSSINAAGAEWGLMSSGRKTVDLDSQQGAKVDLRSVPKLKLAAEWLTLSSVSLSRRASSPGLAEVDKAVAEYNKVSAREFNAVVELEAVEKLQAVLNKFVKESKDTGRTGAAQKLQEEIKVHLEELPMTSARTSRLMAKLTQLNPNSHPRDLVQTLEETKGLPKKQTQKALLEILQKEYFLLENDAPSSPLNTGSLGDQYDSKPDFKALHKLLPEAIASGDLSKISGPLTRVLGFITASTDNELFAGSRGVNAKALNIGLEKRGDFEKNIRSLLKEPKKYSEVTKVMGSTSVPYVEAPTFNFLAIANALGISTAASSSEGSKSDDPKKGSEVAKSAKSPSAPVKAAEPAKAANATATSEEPKDISFTRVPAAVTWLADSSKTLGFRSGDLNQLDDQVKIYQQAKVDGSSAKEMGALLDLKTAAEQFRSRKPGERKEATNHLLTEVNKSIDDLLARSKDVEKGVVGSPQAVWGQRMVKDALAGQMGPKELLSSLKKHDSDYVLTVSDYICPPTSTLEESLSTLAKLSSELSYGEFMVVASTPFAMPFSETLQDAFVSDPVGAKRLYENSPTMRQGIQGSLKNSMATGEYDAEIKKELTTFNKSHIPPMTLEEAKLGHPRTHILINQIMQNPSQMWLRAAVETNAATTIGMVGSRISQTNPTFGRVISFGEKLASAFGDKKSAAEAAHTSVKKVDLSLPSVSPILNEVNERLIQKIDELKRMPSNQQLAAVNAFVGNITVSTPEGRELMRAVLLQELGIAETPSAAPVGNLEPRLQAVDTTIKSHLAESSVTTGNILRSNTPASRLIKEVSVQTGSAYRKSALGPTVDALSKLSTPLEINPAKISDEDLLKANAKVLTELTRTLFEGAIGNPQNLPADLKALCKQVYDSVKNNATVKVADPVKDAKASTTAALNAVTGTLMLRLLNPALLVPNLPESGLLPSDHKLPAPYSRNALLVSKIFQNLANGVRFGGKESFMEPFNVLLDDYFPVMNRLLADIVAEPVDWPVRLPAASSSEAAAAA